MYFLLTLSCEQELCEPMSLLHSSRASSCEQKLCEPISLLHSSRVSSCEQKLCEPISLLYSSRASSCEQKLCEPISLSLERALSSETGSQDPCSARHAVTAWQHFMLLWWVLLCQKQEKRKSFIFTIWVGAAVLGPSRWKSCTKLNSR